MGYLWLAFGPFEKVDLTNRLLVGHSVAGIYKCSPETKGGLVCPSLSQFDGDYLGGAGAPARRRGTRQNLDAGETAPDRPRGQPRA
jgi:hypothetical protein